MSGLEDAETSREYHKAPHSVKKHIPTVQQYRELKREERQELDHEDGKGTQHALENNARQAQDNKTNGSSYKSSNIEEASGDAGLDQHRQIQSDSHSKQQSGTGAGPHSPEQDQNTVQDTSETAGVQGISDPKQKRKQISKGNVARAEREVTDPVTHNRINIHDYTDQDLKKVEEEGRDDDNDGIDDGNEDSHTDQQLTKAKSKTDSELLKDDTAQRRAHDELYNRFPPPQWNEVEHESARVQDHAMLFLLSWCGFAICIVYCTELFIPQSILTIGERINVGHGHAMIRMMAVGSIALGYLGTRSWSRKKHKTLYDDAIWHAHNVESRKALRHGPQETTLWLSKLIGSIWPLVNPDLFVSIGDTLEDVMQASLPSFVRMVSVEDIGQGSEPLRILGVKWLPKGAASRSVDSNEGQDKTSAGDEQADGDHAQDDQDTKADQVATQDSNEGMGAEEGEFVNIEIAFAYRASQFQKGLKDRAKNAHLLLGFFPVGGLKLPVWVELRGVVGACRARLQLTPDPPFVALCTLTFLGQPKVEMSCVPLFKKGLNLMNMPLLSKFVQGSIDAALSEYVTPKSIPLDLQAMLAGEDFKKDTTARGVLVCRIKRAFDFKASDVSMPIVGGEKSSDPYVSVAWAKFGKPLWSTRIVAADMHPYWEETAYLLVTPEELDAEESIRIQLWDSDKSSADDDLGRIELVLKDLMRDSRTNGKMCDRTDSFKALEAGKGMPGKLEWSVGYFSKVRLLESQMKAQVQDEKINSIEDLKKEVYQGAEKKLRETAKNESAEREQLKEEDWEAKQIDIISSTVPPIDYPSGILSIQIHQIVGLSMENTRKNKNPEEEEVTELDEGDNLPDSFCTIILNDQKVFRTRTKPKSAAPFFNAGTERFVRDWRKTTVMVSVRDQRAHEDDAFLGHIYLNVGELFNQQKRSRVNSWLPLSGGIGYGRMRVSIVFRSTRMQMPMRELGWDLGVAEIAPEAEILDNIPKEISGHRITLHSDTSKGHMHASRVGSNEARGKWSTRHDQALLLAVRKRYASNVTLQFKASSSSVLPKSKQVVAFCVIWLKEVADEQWADLQLPIYRNENKLHDRATANVLPDEELQDQKIGVLQVRIRFWRGLGLAHKRIAKRNIDVANVLEVRDAARELGNGPPVVGATGWRNERDSGSTAADAAEESNDESGSDGNDNDSKVSKIGSAVEGNRKAVGEIFKGDTEHMSKVGAMAQHARRKIPGTRAHKQAKSEDMDTGSDELARHESSPSSNDNNVGGGEPAGEVSTTNDDDGPVHSKSISGKSHLSEQDTQATQSAPSAPQASIGPSYGGGAVKNELQSDSRSSSNKPQEPAAPTKTETQNPNRAPDTEAKPAPNSASYSELDTQKSQEAPSAVQATAGPSHGSDAVRQSLNSRDRNPSQPRASKENHRPSTSNSQKERYSLFPRDSTSSRPTSRPRTPPQSRPTTATTASSNAPSSTPQQSSQAPSTPKTSTSTPGDTATTPSPESGHKRHNGILGSLRRSFSLRGSPQSKDGKNEKRASRLFSSDNSSSAEQSSSSPVHKLHSRSRPSTSARPSSAMMDRSPLASHPTADSEDGETRDTKQHSGSTPQNPESVHSPLTSQSSAPVEADTGKQDPNEQPLPSPHEDDAAAASATGAGGGADDEDNENSEQLHRRHRGIMQMPAARTGVWAKHKIEGAVGQVQKGLDMGEREKVGGVEKEV
ncbi:MAG: hypothetical protein Q9162_000674 [Coniocarpon cinnabarinum]